MGNPRRSKVRDARIVNEIIVDAYGEAEQTMGWYYYLENKLVVPFKARCTKQRPISPLTVGEPVEVLGMAPEDECQHEMFVWVNAHDRRIAVPLSQLKPISSDPAILEAVEDWHYWVQQRNPF